MVVVSVRFSIVERPHRDIRFASTEDGIDIAFWEIGSGIPIVIIQNYSLSHLEAEWDVPSIASFYLDLAERYRVIRLDPRGGGLSGDLPVPDEGERVGSSAADLGMDVSAVVAACDIDRFVLMAVNVTGPVGIEYAATHPDRVIGLILCDGVAKIKGSYMEPLMRGQQAIVQTEREWGAQMPMTLWDSIVPEEERHRWSALIRTDRERRLDRGLTIQWGWDAEAFLGDVEAATLILASRDPGVDRLSEARRIAAGIPNAQLRMVDGSWSPYLGDRQAVLDAIDKLLGPEDDKDEFASSGFRTVVFTDIVESTEYVRQVGDEAGRTAIRRLETQVASLATDNGGRVVKNLGDGSLVSFGSNSSAIAFALELQEACSEGPLQLRIGMAAGEPIQEDGDIHGTVVAQASRIGDLGNAGEVVVSDSVRQLAAGKGFTFEPKGEVSLKGFDEPERVWKVTQTPRP
jgi:class 3 adenylate cyclase